LVVIVACFESNTGCNPDTYEIGTELFVNVGCLESNNVDNPDSVEIFNDYYLLVVVIRSELIVISLSLK
jgi:hypothetical protein